MSKTSTKRKGNEMKQGDIVRIRQEWRDAGEPDLRYVLLEDPVGDGGETDTVDITCLDLFGDWAIRPTSRVQVRMIQRVEG